jgi:hypothetical protein
MTTGTIVTIVVTVATVSLITLATLVAVCPRTFSDLLFVITVTQLVIKGYSWQIDRFMLWTVKL